MGSNEIGTFFLRLQLDPPWNEVLTTFLLQVLADLHQACAPTGSSSGTSSEDQSKGTIRTCYSFSFLTCRSIRCPTIFPSHITSSPSSTASSSSFSSPRGLRPRNPNVQRSQGRPQAQRDLPSLSPSQVCHPPSEDHGRYSRMWRENVDGRECVRLSSLSIFLLTVFIVV